MSVIPLALCILACIGIIVVTTVLTSTSSLDGDIVSGIIQLDRYRRYSEIGHSDPIVVETSDRQLLARASIAIQVR